MVKYMQNNIYVNIVGCLHSDVVGESYSTTECQRDIAEMRSRVKHQGITFLTKDLPRLGKAIDLALAKHTRFTLPQGFKPLRGSQLPQYLGALMKNVFALDGCIHANACVQSLKSLRQICYSFYKLELPYAEKDTKRVIDAFIQTEQDLNYHKDNLTAVERHILSTARDICHSVIGNVDPRSITPRHGPGVVSTGEKPWEKPHFEVYNKRIASVYPYEDFFFIGYTHLVDRLDRYLGLPEVEHRAAKVVLVPKDSRGPRLISCEPVENQWIQQGQMTSLVRAIQAHPLTRGHVNFTDQTFNRWYAWLGSRTGDLVTLDMKEASDRVSLNLVQDLLPCGWFEALCASRSSETVLPDGRVVHMKKFAPMGSAVCFPVEALCFYALGVAAIMSKHNVGFDKAHSSYYVYGDDLICSLEYHEAILQHLPAFGLLLNDEKCCTAGFFRESCGMDAYKGTDVTPTKIRRVWASTSSRLAPDTYISYVAYSNAMYEHGYYATAQYIEDEIRHFYPRTPTFNKDGGCVAFVRSDKYCRNISNKKERNLPRYRYNRRLHREEVLGFGVVPIKKRLGQVDWEELLRVKSYELDASIRGSVSTDPLGISSSYSWKEFSESILSPVKTRDVLREIALLLAEDPDEPTFVRSGVYPVPHRYRLQLRWTALP